MTFNFDHIKKGISQVIVVLLAFICFITVGCGNSNNSTGSEKLQDDVKYKDGTYCADVTYYSPNTGTKRTYTLNVEVENKELTKIYWSNGGWLDNSHFTPPEINDAGSCSFRSDKGYQYTVEITGSECPSTSSSVTMEGNDEPREIRLTLDDCASSIQMTESELSYYETTFNISRQATVSEKMCGIIHEYIVKKRDLDDRRGSLQTLMENGYIQKKYSIGSEDYMRCQTLVVKRRGQFYLLEVQGSKQATMGLMDFDPTIKDWQEVRVMEDPSKLVWQVFYMRVVDQSTEMTSLAEKMETFCKY
jgi:uncharacterized lipoprotein NlpE involved in copper resistance